MADPKPLPYPALPFLLAARKADVPFNVRGVPGLEEYQRFVLRNAPRVAAVERILRGIAFTSGGVVALLDQTKWKGRLGDSLYMQEFCLMVINIVANFHTAIFSLSGLFAPGKMTPIHTRLQNAFMRAQLSRLGDEPYGALALVFQLFTFVEKFAEIWALKRLGDSGRWNVVVLIEGVKTAIRLACFRLLGFRGPLQPRVVPERDLTLTLPKPPGTVTPPMGPATTNMEASMSMSVSDLALMPSVLSDDEAAELVGVLSGWDRAAEYAFILRPIVYSLLLRRSSAQGTLKTAWTPYLVSLAMDLSSVSVQAWKVFNGNPTWLEEDEMVRRLHLLLYYLLREPVFTLYTKPVLQRFFRYAARRPVVNLLTFILLEYSAYWGRGLYFYSAASS